MSASIKPRSNDRGKDLKAREDRLVERASIKPRSNDRGKVLLDLLDD